MRIESLEAFELRIPFKTAFKHATAERASTQTAWVEVRSSEGVVGYGEGCPREYVTGESLGTARAFVSAHLEEWREFDWTVSALAGWIERHRANIDTNPAAWCAVELALLDLLGKTAGRSVEALLNLPEPRGIRSYTAVIGEGSSVQFESQLAFYLRAGFQDFKIKLSQDAGKNLAAVKILIRAGVAPGRVRADANNLWPDAATAIGALRALGFSWFAIEEPLPPGDFAGLRSIAHTLGAKIILDESILRQNQLDELSADAGQWLVNVRVSKMGGLLRTMDLLSRARRLGLKAIIGAHVGESSLLTRAALTAATATGELLVAQEGAFGTHLLAHDVVEQPIMFGASGMLDVSALHLAGAPGFGLRLAKALPLFPAA